MTKVSQRELCSLFHAEIRPNTNVVAIYSSCNSSRMLYRPCLTTWVILAVGILKLIRLSEDRSCGLVRMRITGKTPILCVIPRLSSARHGKVCAHLKNGRVSALVLEFVDHAVNQRP